MIQVTEKADGSFDISWDEKDPVEKILNTWTEQDFVNVIKEHLKKLDNDKKR